MLFSSIKIKDFLSIAEASISFNGAGLILIDGYNHDDESANGAGKTAIFNAIIYCLYGKLPRKITASEIARHGTSIPKVVITTQCGISITRNKPTKLSVIKDGVDVVNPQSFIESAIGMSYEQFCLIGYNPQNSTRFLEMNDSQKKDFFIELLALSDIDVYKDKIDAVLKQAIDEESLLNKQLGENQARVESYQGMLQIVPEPEDISELASQLKEIELLPPDLSKYDELEASIKASIEEVKLVNSLKNELISIKESIDVLQHSYEREQQSHAVECPACQHNFDHRFNETGPSDDTISKSIHKLTNRKIKIEARLALITTKETEDTLQALLSKCLNKKKAVSKDFMEAQTQHTILSKQLAKLEAINANITSIEQNNVKISKNIAKFTQKIQEASDGLTAIKERLDVLKQAKAIFSPSGLPAYILDNAISFFNERISFYLCKIWPNASFFLNSYKETKGGEIKAKMSESFYNLGQERSISSLSGGEYRLLSIAVDMAITDMFSYMTGTSINFIAWDEPFDGLDASNRNRIWPILNEFAENKEIWLIDHSTEFKSMFLSTIEIHKRDGISSVV